MQLKIQALVVTDLFWEFQSRFSKQFSCCYQTIARTMARIGMVVMSWGRVRGWGGTAFPLSHANGAVTHVSKGAGVLGANAVEDGLYVFTVPLSSG